MPTFGSRISKQRHKCKMSIQELANRAQLGFHTVWRIEEGKIKEPGIFTAKKLASELGCTVDYLVGMHEREE